MRTSDPAGLEVLSRYCRVVTGNPTDLELNPPSTAGLSGEYHALAEQLATPDTTALAAWPPSLSAVNSVDSLRRFVAHHATETLSAQEWPVILQAWQLAREGKSCELIALDGDWGRRVGQADFAGASFRVGRRQLSRLRGLRHERVIQKYLAAIESGDARGWHPIVYGVVLAVYHLPLRQGLMNFGIQTLASLITAAERAHRLPAAECQELLDATCALLPARLPALPGIAIRQHGSEPV
ncbi:MAG: hypothetical protein RIS76_3666 [Verrucomicrobiota bacterium]